MIVSPTWRLQSALRYVWRPLLILFAWDVIIAGLFELGQTWVSLEYLPMSMVGAALALLVAFRNNSAYARWWEARQLWGGVVNYSRTLARQVRLYVPDAATATEIVELQVAFAHALRCHLRRQEPWPDIAPFVAPELLARLGASSNIPEALLRALADRLATLRQAGRLDTIALTAFDSTLAELANMQGGLERIKNTPMFRQYIVFPRIFVHVFCALLPLAMVSSLELLTPLGSTVVGWIFLVLDRTGGDIESPFENSIHDVPMTAITRTIEINLREGLGQSGLPAPLQPQDGVLW